MDFEIMSICFEVIDRLLPICRQNFTRGPSKSLIDLARALVFAPGAALVVGSPHI